MRAQLSRAHRGEPARRVAPKTPASVREVPLVEQLSHQLAAHKQASPFATSGDWWVFATSRGTPYGHRNVARRVLTRAADAAQLNDDGWPPLRFHDLRHTFASHLIVDLGLDVAQVSRILGHARSPSTPTPTSSTPSAIRVRFAGARMAASQFASLLDGNISETPVSVLPLTQRGMASWSGGEVSIDSLPVASRGKLHSPGHRPGCSGRQIFPSIP